MKLQDAGLFCKKTACHGEDERPPKENDRPWPEAIGGRAWLSFSISKAARGCHIHCRFPVRSEEHGQAP